MPRQIGCHERNLRATVDSKGVAASVGGDDLGRGCRRKQDQIRPRRRPTPAVRRFLFATTSHHVESLFSVLQELHLFRIYSALYLSYLAAGSLLWAWTICLVSSLHRPRHLGPSLWGYSSAPTTGYPRQSCFAHRQQASSLLMH